MLLDIQYHTFHQTQPSNGEALAAAICQVHQHELDLGKHLTKTSKVLPTSPRSKSATDQKSLFKTEKNAPLLLKQNHITSSISTAPLPGRVARKVHSLIGVEEARLSLSHLQFKVRPLPMRVNEKSLQPPKKPI